MPTYFRMQEIVARGLSTEIAEAYYEGLVAGVREMMEMDEEDAVEMTMDDIDPFFELDKPTKTRQLSMKVARNLGRMRGLLVGYVARFDEAPRDDLDDEEEEPPRRQRRRTN